MNYPPLPPEKILWWENSSVPPPKDTLVRKSKETPPFSPGRILWWDKIIGQRRATHHHYSPHKIHLATLRNYGRKNAIDTFGRIYWSSALNWRFSVNPPLLTKFHLATVANTLRPIIKTDKQHQKSTIFAMIIATIIHQRPVHPPQNREN